MSTLGHRCLLVLLLLVAPVCAQDLWVRNQPFKGYIQGSGSDMLVELDTFLNTLEIEAEDKGDVIIIGGFPIPVETSGDVRLIPLRDVVDAAGLRLSKNPALGTVDVRIASAGTGSRGNWNKTTDTSKSSTKLPSVKLGNEAFSVRVPGHLRVVAAPEFLRSDKADNVKTTDLSSERARAMGAKTAFFVSTKKGEKAGYLSLSLFEGMRSTMTAEKEPVALKGLKGLITELGGRITGSDSILTVAGKRYHKFSYSQAQKVGKPSKNEAYVHFSNKHRIALFLVVTAPKAKFNRVAPQLRLVLRNIRMK